MKHAITIAGHNVPVETCDWANTTSMALGCEFRWSAYAYAADLGALSGEGPTEAGAIAALHIEMMDDLA